MTLTTPRAPWDPQQPEPIPSATVELVSTPDRPTLVQLTDPAGRPVYVSPAHVIGVGSSDDGGGSTLMMLGGSGAMVTENVMAVLWSIGARITDPDEAPEPTEPQDNERGTEWHELAPPEVLEAAQAYAAQYEARHAIIDPEDFERDIMEPARRAAEAAGLDAHETTTHHHHPLMERITALLFGRFKWELVTDKGRLIGKGRARTLAGAARGMEKAAETDRIRRELRMTTD